MTEDSVTSFQIEDDVDVDVSHLSKQDLKQLDVSSLTPLTPEVISRQATINIGTIGHVAHGKSTVVKSISGVQTVRFKSELRRNITIKLGYANAKLYRCDGETHKGPAYCGRPSITPDAFPCDQEGCKGMMRLVRHVSFVDCFGPDAVFATPTGTIRNADIVPGSVLLGPDGGPRVVGSVIDGAKPMYEVQLKTSCASSAETDRFTASGGHLLCLRIDAPVEPPFFDAAKGVYIVRHFSGANEAMSYSKVLFASEPEAVAYFTASDKTPLYFSLTVEAYLSAPRALRRRARMYLPGPMRVPSAPAAHIGTATPEETAWLLGLCLAASDPARPSRLRVRAPEALRRAAAVAHKMALAPLADGEDGLVLSALPEFCAPEFWAATEFHAFGRLWREQRDALLLAHAPDVRAALVAGIMDARGTCVAPETFVVEQRDGDDEALVRGVLRVVRTLGLPAQCARLDGALNVRFFAPDGALPFAAAELLGKKIREERLSLGGGAVTWAGMTSVAFGVRAVGVGPFRKWAVDGDGLVLLESFVVGHNCPGHDILMATMLNGAAVMDAALLLVAGNENCPQPQTSEHLAAIEIMRLRHIIILQNKIDLVKEPAAREQHKQILEFVQGTIAEGAPVIPISAQLKYNIDVVCEYLCAIPLPPRDFVSSPRLIVIRSFDVNRPGTFIDELKGGVAGGSILQGVLRLGDPVEVRPGIVTKDAAGNFHCVSIVSVVVSLYAERNDLQYAVPGGLIGVGTNIDPTLCRADRLVGQVLGERGKLPGIFLELEVNFFLLRRLLGVKSVDGSMGKVGKLQKNETLMINIGSTSTGGRVVAVKKDLAKMVLLTPVCTTEGEKIALSRKIESHWRLIGWGKILRGAVIEPEKEILV